MSQNENILSEGSCLSVSSSEFGVSQGASRPDYWQLQLADAPALELPTDQQRPASLSRNMGMESSSLSDHILSGLQQVSEDAGVEVSTVALAVFAVMLHRYAAQEKFVVGVASAGQVLPIVVDFSGHPSFRNLLQRMEAVITTGSAMGAVPAELLANSGLDADPSRHFIYQVGFSAETNSTSSSLSVETPGLDLNFEFVLSSRATFRISYNRDLFERGTAMRMLGHLQTLVAGVISNSDHSAVELPMLTESELHELLIARNKTSREFPAGCLHEHVEHIAASSPDQIAVVHAHEELSYGELNARANQLAYYLRKRGVGCNSRIGICLERSLDFAVALIGVLKAGGTCVPLDPKYPNERLAYMMEDVAASIVLTQRGLLKAAVPSGTQVVFLSEERERILRELRSNPSSVSSPSDIAYVIYTSGSTGKPRGVLLRHAGLVSYTLAAAEQFELHAGDRMLQFCSISFDAALEEIYTTWAAGATLVFREDDVSLEPGEFLRWISEQRITVVDLPTAFWHEWVYALPELSQKVPPALRLVIVGGEKASPEAYSTWHKLVGSGVRWVNTYGPAEASVVATAYEPKLQPGEEPPAQLPIGRPVANTQVYLLDPALNPVPVGVPGEIHIGGIGVAKGYLNLPQLTEQKFIRDIFSDDPSARMYKTGDLAKYLPNGVIEFVGRRDNQVKIRGFRVEPGEIESVLSKHPGVQENAIVLRQGSTGDKRLVGYVVCSNEALVESELRQHVKAHLPEYMVPSEFVFLDSMPLTPNGKIDRRALAALKSDSHAAVTPASTINDPLQLQLISIWEELLGRKPIGIRDNFFELGGHSLLAARMMHRIKQLHGQSLPLAILLQASTVEKLASVIRGDFSQHWASLVAVQPEGSKPPFFCVHGVGGNVVGFHELAKRMKPDFPFYGLQSQGLDGKSDLNTTIESMATHYLEEIRTIQPQGPYHLGGFSMGGLVAYEMAQQLVAAGEEVGLVVLFDTYASKPKSVNESLKDLLLHPTWSHVKRLPSELRKKFRRTWKGMQVPAYLKKVMRTNAQAADNYVLRPYQGKTILLRAGDTWRVADDPYAAWKGYVAELETIQIRGTHMEILREPNVSTLAERLKSCIHGASESFDQPELLASNA